MYFLKKINKILDGFVNFLRQKHVNMTDEEKRKHKAKTFCYLCREEFNKNAGNCCKVKDHCHFTGKY